MSKAYFLFLTLSSATRIRQPNKINIVPDCCNDGLYFDGWTALMLVPMMNIRPMWMGVNHGLMIMGMVMGHLWRLFGVIMVVLGVGVVMVVLVA